MMLALASLALAVWLVQLVLALRIARAIPATADAVAAAPARETWPRLSMIVPARDEAEGIEAALQSKLACGYPALEIVAVDDRSTDGTGALIDRLAAADSRIASAHVSTLPEGWLGKLNAMHVGLQRATGEWVLFSDADVHIEPGVLQRYIAHCEERQIDLLGVFPRMNAVNPVLDACVAVLVRMLSLSGRTWLANDDASHLGLGVGAFNLVRKSTLDRLQALSHLRMEVVDDLALGALVKQSGGRTRFYAGRHDVSITFMPTFGALAKSMAKAGHMMRFSLPAALGVTVLLVGLEIGLIAAPLVAGGLAGLVAAAALAVSVAVNAVICRHYAGPVLGVACWPVGTLVLSALITRGGLHAWRRQGISWRGTFYSRAQLEAGQRLKPGSLRIDLPPVGARPGG